MSQTISCSVYLHSKSHCIYYLLSNSYLDAKQEFYEDADGSIQTKKSAQFTPLINGTNNAPDDHSFDFSDIRLSPDFLSDTPSYRQPQRLSGLGDTQSHTSTASTTTANRTSSSSNSTWSKLSQEEFEYRERNSFFLLPPPPPPRSSEALRPRVV